MTQIQRNPYRISTLVHFGIPLKDALERLVRSGWRSIEIMCEDTHSSLLDWNEEQLTWIDQLTETYGIAWSLHAPIKRVNLITSGDTGTINQSYRLLKRTFDIAERLKASYVVLHPGFTEQSIPRAKAVAQTADFLRRLIIETNGEHGIPIALENVPPKVNQFGSNCDFLMDVIDEVKSPRLKILLDVGHAHMVGADQSIVELNKCKPHLIGLHLNDNRGHQDEHLAVGRGTIPFNKLIQELRDMDNELIWVLEMADEVDAYRSMTLLDELKSYDGCREQEKERARMADERQIYTLATNWVIEAGEQIKQLLQTDLKVDTKANHADLVTVIDQQVERFLVDHIRTHYPDHNIIGEESIGDSNSDSTYLWIIDPIDGTTNMINRKQDFAISVAFCRENTGVFGIVYDVMSNKLFHAFKNEGAFLNQSKLEMLPTTRLDQQLLAFNPPWSRMEHEDKWHSLFRLASSARGIRVYGATTIELCDLAVGKLGAFVQCFIKSWDYAASRVILEEIGCVFTDLEGNKINMTYDGGIIAGTEHVHRQMLQLLIE